MPTFKEMGIDSFPLCWPPGWRRAGARKSSKFKASFAPSRDQLFRELKLLGCPNYNVILSSNIPLRKDGIPYAGQANPQDPGFAVYFSLNNKPMVFACDQYKTATDNLWAIAKSIEALRGIKRWGASDMMERSFTGFAALPPSTDPKPKFKWWKVLNFNGPIVSKEQIQERWKSLATIHHPDRGGDPSMMAEINAARDEGLRENGNL